MDTNQIIQITTDASELFKTMMSMYSAYFDTIESLINATPESDIQTLIELKALMADINESMEHDIMLFRDAIESGKEDLSKLKEGFQIEDIYKKLNQKNV